MSRSSPALKEEARQQLLQKVKEMDKTIPPNGYPYPLNVIVEPTNICNLRCSMCPSPVQTRPRGTMSSEMWRKIVDDVVQNSPTSNIWPAIMGEGLVAKETFVEMLEYGCQAGANIYWNTNAGLLTDEWIQRVSKLPLKEIIIGLDATKAEAYSKIRVKGNFQRTVSNVLKLLEHKNEQTKITVQFIEQEHNRDQKAEFTEFWLSKGAVVKTRSRLGWGEGVDSPDLLLEQSDRVGPCPWLMRTISIHWNGNVVQCDADWNQKFPVGNIADSTIQELWDGELARRRSQHRAGDFSFELCRTCSDWQAGISEIHYPA